MWSMSHKKMSLQKKILKSTKNKFDQFEEIFNKNFLALIYYNFIFRMNLIYLCYFLKKPGSSYGTAVVSYYSCFQQLNPNMVKAND